jgi:hypothetical protein
MSLQGWLIEGSPAILTGEELLLHFGHKGKGSLDSALNFD